MATPMQRKAFKETVKALEQGEDVTWMEILKSAGYSDSVAKNPKQVIDSDGFRELLSKLDDSVLLGRLYSIALGGDKRASLKAIDMTMKLKDRYPAGKLKVGTIEEKLGDILVDVNSSQGETEDLEENEDNEPETNENSKN